MPLSHEEEALRHPVGRYQPPPQITAEDRTRWIAELEALPSQLKQTINGLSEEQLDTPYRPGGWTIRQVVHHLPDSHMNSYVRFRFALTEDAPLIKPYSESVWAQLADAKSAPVDLSLGLLENLHARWIILLRSLSDDQFARVYRHPESGDVRLDKALGLYAWHGRHHLAHIANLRQRNGW